MEKAELKVLEKGEKEEERRGGGCRERTTEEEKFEDEADSCGLEEQQVARDSIDGWMA